MTASRFIPLAVILMVAALGLSGCGATGESDEIVGVRWILETLDGNPPVEGTYATLTVSDDSFGGYDGCNSFSIRRNVAAPAANPDGTPSPVVLVESTLQLCERSDGDSDIMDQAGRVPGFANRCEEL